MHAGLVLAAIVAVTVLGIDGTIDGQSVVAVLGTAIGFAGASATSVGSLAQAVNGKSVISTAAMADREATLRAAVSASGGNVPTPSSLSATVADAAAEG